MTSEEHLDKIVEKCRQMTDSPYPAFHAAFTSALIAIEGLRLIADKGSHPESSSAKCDLHKIIAAWPEELL